MFKTERKEVKRAATEEKKQPVEATRVVMEKSENKMPCHDFDFDLDASTKSFQKRQLGSASA